jgi:hypothetical protein
MYLTSVTQRDRLFQLVVRWFADRPDPDDGKFITQVFLYENVIWVPTLRRFVLDVLTSTQPGPVHMQRLRTKDELRALLSSAFTDLGPRSRELFEKYKLYPEEFFPGTPADVVLAMRDDGRPIGMVRIKRLKRIAEKASRRVADFLAGRIRQAAQENAAVRAVARGIPLEFLISSPETMFDDFARAERDVSRTFREENLTFAPQDLRLDDVIGIKFVGTEEELDRVERAIKEHPQVVGLEREEHRGKYNDINLLVDLELPPPPAILQAAQAQDWSKAGKRGLSPEVLASEFPDYVYSGARTVRAEVILTTCEELIESEFGRAIHEQRILEQRTSVPYSGRIAGNASFLIEYLLMLAISPKVELEEIPIKMWGRYLPDIYSLAVWDLFDIRLGLELEQAFSNRTYHPAE